MENLTPHFIREEFACKCGCGRDNMSLILVGCLQIFRHLVNEPIIITSGCRCEMYNKSVGGVDNSLHIVHSTNDLNVKYPFARAVDWTVSNKRKLKRINNMFVSSWFGGWHFYEKDNFIHTDVGSLRRWE